MSEECRTIIQHKLSGSEEDLLLELHNKIFCESQWSKKYLKKFFAEESRMPIFVPLKKADNLMGYALGRIDKKNQSVFLLNTIVVDEEYRGKKYATKIMEVFLREVFKNKKIQKVVLHYRESKNLRDFYEKLGFGNHKIDDVYNDGEEKHCMEIYRRK